MLQPGRNAQCPNCGRRPARRPTRGGSGATAWANGMTRNTATAVNAGSAPTHLSAATCDVSIERSEDCRSTGDCALRLFPLPRPGAVVPVPQDALLWTFRSPELIGRQAARPPALKVCHSCIQSRSCLATGERALVEFARSVALSTQLSCHSRLGTITLLSLASSEWSRGHTSPIGYVARSGIFFARHAMIRAGRKRLAGRCGRRPARLREMTSRALRCGLGVYSVGLLIRNSVYRREASHDPQRARKRP